MKPLQFVLLMLTLAACNVFAAEHLVNSAKDLELAVGRAKPGDVILMAAGEWTDLQVKLQFSGEEDQPIIVRAESPGTVVITGRSRVQIEGAHGEVGGLLWHRATVPDRASSLVQIGSRDSGARAITITNCRFIDCNPSNPDSRYAWVQLYGRGHRVSHNEFAGQNHSGVTVQIRVDEEGPEHRIHNNLFRDRAPGDGNGYEMIQIGQSGDSRKRGGCIVQDNWFVRCDGETEIVSSKSGKNIIRGNLFLESSGTVTLRHGTDGLVENNYFIGRLKEASGGVRVVDSGHIVRNNYFTGLTGRTGGVVALYHGIPDSQLSGYFPASNVRIEANVFTDNVGNLIFLDAGFGSRNRVLIPENVIIQNNLWLGLMNGAVAVAGTAPDVSLDGNQYGSGVEIGLHEARGIRPVGEDVDAGLWSPLKDRLGPSNSWPSRTEVGVSWHLPLPRLTLFNPGQLVRLARSDDPESAAIRYSLLEAANEILDVQKLYSVTDNDMIPPSGDNRDYYSTGPYWWPNPETPDGLPYVLIDGKFNPERDRVSDRGPLLAMINDVEMMAFAYAVSGDERFARWGHRLLYEWFLDPERGMNPNLRHAQAIPGRSDGRGTGIIDTHPFAELIDAILILQESPGFPFKDVQGLHSWFSRYLDWLLYSPNGRDEADSVNNHGTAFDLQVAAIMAFLGREDQLRDLLIHSVLPRIDQQIGADGGQPNELRRTRTWSYSTENLEHFFKLGIIGRGVGVDLFSYRTPEGASLKKALEYLLPAICDPSKWPHAQATDWQEEFILSVISIAERVWSHIDYVRYRNNCLKGAPNQLEAFLLRAD